MSKTAEEILHEHMSGKDIDELPNAGVSALREFAAQEVEAYKSKLRKEVQMLNETRGSWLLERVLYHIDTVK